MSLSQYDPRDLALWTPGPVTLARPAVGRYGQPSEQDLILQALENRRAARRRPRRRPFARLRLAAKSA
ncbi:MAG TPA: hypothetical protein VK020_15680 [Microlunatus sp.]|nr:hypothetical protein [Microlunatus sp.]